MRVDMHVGICAGTRVVMRVDMRVDMCVPPRSMRAAPSAILAPLETDPLTQPSAPGYYPYPNHNRPMNHGDPQDNYGHNGHIEHLGHRP